MANVKTEYFEEYCSRKKNKHENDSHNFVICSSDITRQAVGGRVAEARRLLRADSVAPSRQPSCDEDYLAAIYAGVEHATHRVEPNYKVIYVNNYMHCPLITHEEQQLSLMSKLKTQSTMHIAQSHRRTDGQTGRRLDANSQSCCAAVRSAKNRNVGYSYLEFGR